VNRSDLTPPSDLPVSDARIPALAVRVALAVVGILLTVLVYGAGGWVAVGVIFTVLAAWVPEYLLSWLVIVFLAIGQLSRPADLNWKLLVLIAGLHLLHVLGSLALALPWRSWVQPRVFTRPLLRFVAIQVPVQVLAVIALPLLAPNSHGHRPLTAAAFTIVGEAALGVLALLMLRLGVSRPASSKSRATVDLQANQTAAARRSRTGN
jgi:hypothetical protein